MAIPLSTFSSTPPAKTSLLIHGLRCGGAELVASVLASGLQRRGYDVSLLTLRGPETPFYPLNSDVQLVPLDVVGDAPSLRERWRRTRRGIRSLQSTLDRLRPDVLIGFMTEANVLSVLATRLLGHHPCRLIATEHVHPAHTRSRHLACAARLATLPFTDAIVPVSDALASWYRRWIHSSPVRVITNPVVTDQRPDDAEAREVAERIAPERWLLAMGRLHPQKGFDLLIDAFAHLPNHLRERWHLGIIGDGASRGEIGARIRKTGLTDRVELLGTFRNPCPILRAGNAFCLSSRYEGFALALAEAMACGLPAVSFDCPSGPGEIIREGVDGVLVPPGDVQELAKALERLMDDEALRRQMALRAPEVKEKFGEERFLDEWEGLIRRL